MIQPSRLLALSTSFVAAAPALAQSQPPFLEAESLNPVAATLPAIDIATQGEQVAVSWFAWIPGSTFGGGGPSDSVITLFSRDGAGSIVHETVSQIHSIPTSFGFSGFVGLLGPTLIDVTLGSVVSAQSSWDLQTTGGPSIFYPFNSSVNRHVRQPDGTWSKTIIGGDLYSHPLDVAATDDLVVWAVEYVGWNQFHFTFPDGYAVYAAEPATPPGWTVKTVVAPGQVGLSHVDTDGESIVVGDDVRNAPAPAKGRVLVHRRNGSGTWQLEQTLTASDTVPGDRFGSDVSIDRNRLAVSAVLPGTGTFVAYIFERAPGTTGPWSEVGKLVPPPPYAAPVSPPSTLQYYRKQSIVALEGGRVVISQPTSDVHAPGAGSADVFMRTPAGVWEHSVRLAPRIGTTTAFTSMDADGDRVVAAAVGSAPDRGRFDVYDFGSLLAVGDGPSLTTAAPQTLAIDEGVENGGDAYAIVGSLTGTSPGVPVPTTPYTLPLVLDPYFAYTLQSIGGGGLLSAPFGVLDNRGRATCDFTIPTGLPASLVGVSIFHAAVIFDLQAPGVPATHVTNPVTSVLLP